MLHLMKSEYIRIRLDDFDKQMIVSRSASLGVSMTDYIVFLAKKNTYVTEGAYLNARGEYYQSKK